MYPEDAAADEDCSIVVGNGTSAFTAARKYSTSVSEYSEYSSSEDAVAGSAAAEEEISCDRYVQFRLGKFDFDSKKKVFEKKHVQLLSCEFEDAVLCVSCAITV